MFFVVRNKNTRYPKYIAVLTSVLLLTFHSFPIVHPQGKRAEFPRINFGHGNCFPSTAKVSLQGGASVTMSKLRVGDKVQTGNDVDSEGFYIRIYHCYRPQTKFGAI